MREETSVARLKTTRCGWHEMGWRESQGPTHQLSSRLCEWSGFYPEYSGEPPKGRKQGMTGSGQGFKKIILTVAWRIGHRPEIFWILLALKIIENHQAAF